MYILNMIKINSDNLQDSYAREIRHYPPANKEWFNSIYAYNKSTIKILPTIDKIISKLIKAHFNSYSRKLVNKVRKARSRRYRVRKTRLSINRILVSRAELKHNNDKVVITVFVYNNEKKYYLKKMKKISTMDQAGRLLKGWTIKEQINFIIYNTNKYINETLSNYLIPRNVTINHIYKFILDKFKEGFFLSEFPKPMFLTVKRNQGIMKNKSKDSYKDKVNAEKNKRRKFINFGGVKINYFLLNKLSKKGLGLISKMQFQKKSFYSYINNKPLSSNMFVYVSGLHQKKYIRDFVSKFLRKEIISIYFRQLIAFNKLKFEKRYVSSLIHEIEKIYNKQVVFNFVNLKYFFMSGSIFSTTLVAKIKNRKNNLLKVMKDSLLMFDLPPIDRQAVYDQIYNKKKIMQNLGITDLTIKPDFNSTVDASYHFIGKHHNKSNNENIEVLDKSISNFTSKGNLRTTNTTTLQLKNYAYKLAKVINLLKHKSVTGIRIEVAGRLTKRNTAARSLFKLRYKGNIKNTDSSDKGLSEVMLRGNTKSNLEYSKLKSKIRIGSYGLKGWVSSG